MNTHWQETRKAINAFKNANPKVYDVIWKNTYDTGMHYMYHHCKQLACAGLIGVAIGAGICGMTAIGIYIMERNS